MRLFVRSTVENGGLSMELRRANPTTLAEGVATTTTKAMLHGDNGSTLFVNPVTQA
ncbi:MAG: hypothetical protein ABIR94_02955 [Rubrivivax sp.]